MFLEIAADMVVVEENLNDGLQVVEIIDLDWCQKGFERSVHLKTQL